MAEDYIYNNEEFAKLLTHVPSIAILIYDGSNIDECQKVIDYTISKDNQDSIKRILLFGKDSKEINNNAEKLKEICPSANIEKLGFEWESSKTYKIDIHNTLVINIANLYCFSNCETNYKDSTLDKFILSKKDAFAVCIYPNSLDLFTLYDYHIIEYFSISDLKPLPTKETSNSNKTSFCKERESFINKCLNLGKISDKDVFFQCMDEMMHGCEVCNQCSNYGSIKYCPFAINKIASFYRNGYYVPQNKKIAHQYEKMAARQGYIPSCIQVADDLKKGEGCTKSIEKAFDIYKKYVIDENSEYCLNQILSLVEEEYIQEPVRIIPLLVHLSKDGNEKAIMTIISAYHNGKFEMPIDKIREKNWVKLGAEKGIPILIKQTAETYEELKQWDDCYEWYTKLKEVNPDAVTSEKIEEIEIFMLTDGSSYEDIVQKGLASLYGYWGTERDVNFAYRCLKLASQKEYSGKGLLGIMYYEGIGVEQDTDYALTLMSEAAENGDLRSIDKLAHVYYESDYDYDPEYEKYYEELIYIIDKEIENGNNYACFLSAFYQYKGFRYACDFNKAFELMYRAAVTDVPEAQYYLAQMYKDGIGTEKSIEQYNYWLKESAENGYYKGQGEYALQNSEWIYYCDIEIIKMLKSAYEQGYNDAAWKLCQVYLNGIKIDKNEKEGYRLLQIAAEQGIADAEEKLCKVLFRGNEFIEKDYNLCCKWGEEAMKQGKKDIRFEVAYCSSEIGNNDRAKELYLELSEENNGAAMNNYACLLTDQEEKTVWFRKSAEAGDEYGYWNLGKQYYNGRGVDVDYKEAARLYKIAAEKGQKDAMIDLAEMYENGTGMDIDVSEAAFWYEKAYNAGKKEALLRLGSLYKNRATSSDDIQRSIHYYKIAVENEDVTAMVRLGELHEKDNKFLIKDIHKAIYWYRKAAEKGNKVAKKHLQDLKTNWIEDDEIKE